MTADFKRWTVAIVGGSLAGLATATELSRVTNADITVFEQTAGRLEGRGAGIVMQPEIERLLSISGIQPATVSVPLRERQLLHLHSPPRIFPQPQTMTAWDTLYRVPCATKRAPGCRLPSGNRGGRRHSGRTRRHPHLPRRQHFHLEDRDRRRRHRLHRAAVCLPSTTGIQRIRGMARLGETNATSRPTSRAN